MDNNADNAITTVVYPDISSRATVRIATLGLLPKKRCHLLPCTNCLPHISAVASHYPETKHIPKEHS